MPLLALRRRGPSARTGVRPLGAKDNLQLKVSKEPETLVLQSHETEFYQQPE